METSEQCAWPMLNALTLPLTAAVSDSGRCTTPLMISSGGFGKAHLATWQLVGSGEGCCESGVQPLLPDQHSNHD